MTNPNLPPGVPDLPGAYHFRGPGGEYYAASKWKSQVDKRRPHKSVVFQWSLEREAWMKKHLDHDLGYALLAELEAERAKRKEAEARLEEIEQDHLDRPI